jgi:hypothetical protein
MSEEKKDAASADEVKNEAVETSTEETTAPASEETTEAPAAEEVKEEAPAEPATEEPAAESAEAPAKESEVKAEEAPAAEEDSEDDVSDEEAAAAAKRAGVEMISEEVPEVVVEVEEVDDSDDVDPVFSPLESYLDDKGEFDWDALEREEDGYSAEERSKLEVVYESTLSTITEKAVTTGIVISAGKKEVVVNIGYKSEGVLAASEFRYNPDLKAGDEVPVFVEKQEDKYGQLVISHKTARIHSAWINVNAALENDEIIMGFVKCRTKGGLIVDVFGIEAFLPGSAYP